MLCCTKYLHSANIIHRDIKPRNFLVTESCQLKLCDFGLSRPFSGGTPKKDDENKVGKGGRRLSNHVITRNYRPPEVILVEPDYTPAADIWSIGCITAELLTIIKNKGKVGVHSHYQIMFKGQHAFPLTPKKEPYKTAAEYYSDP
mmetsp:Transcript_32133/g.49137  ORF Transcript_32133/g.49137 Transcript_32133/m.49137 type:complete len:145 (+) Transcript_32133:551-985(+)